jgi:hypothetical protein
METKRFRRIKPIDILRVFIAIMVIMALGMPWASADDQSNATGTDVAAEEVEEQTEPSPPPEPETTEPEVPEPEATEPEVPDPEVPEPEVTEPDVTEPETETEEPVEEEATEEAEEPEAVAPEEQAKTEAKPPPGSNGIVKVDGLAFDSHPDNEPKVGCTFQIDYTGFDPNQSFSHSFSIQSGDGSGTGLGGASGSLNANGAGSYTHDLSAALAPFTPKADGYYHVRLDVSLPGVPGGQKHKVFKVKCGSSTDEEGFVIVEKEVLTPNAPAESFNFSGSLGNFGLGDGDSIGPISVEPGSFSVTETISNVQANAGWSFDSVTCSVVAPTILAASDHSANFAVEDGETVKCTFKNAYEEPEPKEEGRVIVKKKVIGDTYVGPQTFSFDGTLGTFELGDGESRGYNVDPGDYTIGEDLSALGEGWSFDSATCTETDSPQGNVASTVQGAEALIDVSDGETVTCVFTNEYEAVLGRIDKKPPPKVLTELVVRERQPDVLGTTARRGPQLPFTGTEGMAPAFLVGLLLITSGLVFVRVARKQQ